MFGKSSYDLKQENILKQNLKFKDIFARKIQKKVNQTLSQKMDVEKDNIDERIKKSTFKPLLQKMEGL
jgi:uncharacterized protein YPO0396